MPLDRNRDPISRIVVSRRDLIWGVAAWSLVGCEKPKPKTPLAHLYGKDWVRGAYSHYAKGYDDIKTRAEDQSFEAYRVVAQKGVTALDGLQQREVPFLIRVPEAGDRFEIERDVPERLMFSADMSEADREAATAAWKLARDHIHTDYAEIRRLNWSLTRLLGELHALRRAIDEGRLEQFRACRQLGLVDEGGELPFELPYQVSREDYRRILLLLLARLDDDRARLGDVESAIVSVGLVVRATDAGSGSLSANIRKVLLAVVQDTEAAEKPSNDYPEAADDRDAQLDRAKKLRDSIVASEEYQSWLAAQREREDVIGNLLVVLDSLTGLPTSKIYRQILKAWQGEGDYLAYLQIVAGLVPGGSSLAGTLASAVETPEKYRAVYTKVRGGIDRADAAIQAIEEGDASALVNTGTRFAKKRAKDQLVFFKTAEESAEAAEELARTSLMKSPLPNVPMD